MDAAGISAALGGLRLPKSIPTSPAPEPESEPAPSTGSRPLVREEPGRSASPAAGASPAPRSVPPPEVGRATAGRLPAGSAAEGPTAQVVRSARAASRTVVFERILSAASQASALPGTKIQLAVQSVEWGSLRIELSLRGSVVQASVVTESEAAREVLASQIDDLRASLERRGLRLEAFRVSVAGSDGTAPDDPPGAPAVRSVRRQVLDVIA